MFYLVFCLFYMRVKNLSSTGTLVLNEISVVDSEKSFFFGSGWFRILDEFFF
jgi:hypothetical protein